ncbi:MAG: excinuclease ABC subunit UvrC [Betaproteobacteria bacterium]|nr:excinuclease ABC subunit UvrC [Betaproteobacteria bacterium]
MTFTPPSVSFDFRAFLPTLPELPGVYRMLDAKDGLLYVGKAKNLKRRVSSYFQRQLPSPRIALMVSRIARIETTVTRSEAEALLLENNLIKRLAPRFNILFRDDKSYPYIVISRGDFPRLAFFRGAPGKSADYFGPFPSANAVRESIQLLQKMFRLRTCEDSVFAHRSRPCLLYQIKRCSGPCVSDLVTQEDYAQDARHAAWFLTGRQNEVMTRLEEKMEMAASRLAFEQAAFYRDQLQSLRQVQEQQFMDSGKGEDADVIVALRENGQLCVNLAMVRGGRHLGDHPFFPAWDGEATPEEAMAAFINQHYALHPAPLRLILSPLPDEEDECAATLEAAERITTMMTARLVAHRAWVNMAEQNARLAILARNQADERQTERLLALREVMELAEIPRRIECFDISHTQGELPVASCVVYQAEGENASGSGMKSSAYRRFNIRDIEPGDDYAAIRQAVTRRYMKAVAGEGVIPDLILIDGGKGQVGAAMEALQEIGLSDVALAGVCKAEGRKTGAESLVFADGRGALQLGAEHPALRLIVEIRDEAHRFAVTGHRLRRGKARKQSRLDSIPGIGATKRKALVSRFGGLAGVREASVEQLAQTPGIGLVLAEIIYAALH